MGWSSSETKAQDRVDYKFAHMGKAMKQVQCWQGAHGNLKRSQEEAAASIVGAACEGPILRLIRGKPDGGDDPAIKDAIIWIAAKLQPKKQKRTKRS